MRKNFHEANYTTLALEIFVVMAGILIAFQIDRWAEASRDREREQQYLVRLKADFIHEIGQMDVALAYAEARLASVTLLVRVVVDPDAAAEQPDAVLNAIETATWLTFPETSAFVYGELQNSGQLGLIRSQSLRRALAAHYVSMDHEARIGFDDDIEELFVRRTAGVLTLAELLRIEMTDGDVESENTSAARAVEVAIELAARADAVALLPSLAQHHTFNGKVIAAGRERAILIIEEIDVLLEEN